MDPVELIAKINEKIGRCICLDDVFTLGWNGRKVSRSGNEVGGDSRLCMLPAELGRLVVAEGVTRK